jgi:hypothetical protein
LKNERARLQPALHYVEIHFIFAPNNTPSNVAAPRIACPAVLADRGRAGTLPAINSPQAISLTVRHFGRGCRDQLPGNYGVARRVEPEAKFFNDFSRARACTRAQGSDIVFFATIAFTIYFPTVVLWLPKRVLPRATRRIEKAIGVIKPKVNPRCERWMSAVILRRVNGWFASAPV